MSDELDLLSEKTIRDETMFIAEVVRHAKAIPTGEPGDCHYCGESFSRVVAVVDPESETVVKSCGRCRDRRHIA